MFKPLNAPDETAVSEHDFRAALRQFASGVTVISTLDEAGGVHGMTATAFCSLSLRPPLVLVAVGRDSRCHAQVLAEKRFGVSILHEGQAHVSRHFAGAPMPEAPEFEALDQMHVLREAMVKLACKLEESVEGGDHSIFVGLVTAAVTNESATPLVHFGGTYYGISQNESD